MKGTDRVMKTSHQDHSGAPSPWCYSPQSSSIRFSVQDLWILKRSCVFSAGPSSVFSPHWGHSEMVLVLWTYRVTVLLQNPPGFAVYGPEPKGSELQNLNSLRMEPRLKNIKVTSRSSRNVSKIKSQTKKLQRQKNNQLISLELVNINFIKNNNRNII